MDIKKVYEKIKEHTGATTGNAVSNIMGFNFNINNKDSNGDTLLHYAVQSNDQETIKTLLTEGIIYNNKNNDGKTPSDVTGITENKDLMQTCELFFKEVKTGNFHEVSKYIMKEKFLVNIKEESDLTPLHWAANNCREDVIILLVENGANVMQFTDIGNTPLHIAVSKNSFSITQLLLKSVSPNKLLQFVNAQTYENKDSCLHIAAENGYIEIVKLLMKYGAIYNIKNKLNNTPFDLCKAENVQNFLKVINVLFMYAKNGDIRLLDELNQMELSEFEAITNTQNFVYHTLTQELNLNHKSIAKKLILLQRNKKQLVKGQWKLEELQRLESCANNHCHFSELYLNMLEGISIADVFDINLSPWKTLKEGSYYLGNIYNFLTLYKCYRDGLIEDENVLVIDATLKKFQFDPDHMSFTIIDDGRSSIFASKAQGQEYYYMLLHSELKTDIRYFLKIVKCNIDEPVKKFLTYIEQQKLLISINLDLIKSIKENNYLAVQNCIRQGADINFLNDGESSLQQAVKVGNADIVKMLLEEGADVKVSSLAKGDTFLHFAATLDAPLYKQGDAPLDITTYLLQHGAVYNANNNEGKTPQDVSKYSDITTLLKNIDTCFTYAEDDNIDLFLILQKMKEDEFKAATQSCSNKGYTLLQTALLTKHKRIENEILKRIKK